ncbi:unnamed protein product [Closterium sp. NIES-65]|nr:unnamed protein product [Closterium sp. NIES-65]
MGFPDKFIAWVKGLHEGATTKLLLNSWLGDCVDMEKGVLQGCLLAPYLFLCAVEPLCHEITRRKLGVRKRGMKGELAYISYADDTTLILKGKDQVERAKKVLDEFADISGLCVNRDKTTLMPLGKNRRRLQPLVTPFKWAEKDKVERLLGIWITSGGSPVSTWDKAFESINACWLGGGTRWRLAVKSLWDSKVVAIGDPAHRWDAEEEQLLFNRKIFFRGKSPFGNRAGSRCLKGVRLGDLVYKWWDGSRTLKDASTLERELGGEEQRKWAMKA